MVCLGWFTLDNFLNYSATNLIKFKMKQKIRCQICYWKWFILGLTFETENEYYSRDFLRNSFYLMFTRREGPFHKTFKVPASEMKYAKGLPNVGVQFCCGIVVNSYFIVTTTSKSQIFVYYFEHINLSPKTDWSWFEATGHG